MMASLRTLVTGNDVCAPSDAAGASNAASSFVNAFLGGRSKQQQQLFELPGVGSATLSSAPLPFTPPSAAEAAEAALRSDLPALPGQSAAISADVDAFLRQQTFHSVERHAAENSPIEVFGQYGRHGVDMESHVIHSVVQPHLQSFFRTGAQSLPATPGIQLSVPDSCRVRNRSTILARQVFADRGNEFADQQVDRLLMSLNVDPASLPADASWSAASGSEWDEIYKRGAINTSSTAAQNAASAAMASIHASTPWVHEFGALRLDGQEQGPVATPTAWAEEFTQTGNQSWVDEFRSSAQIESATRDRIEPTMSTMDQSKQLAETLASNRDPKFQNSKFLQFISKMSRGELIVEDNAVKEVPAAAASWVQEFSTQAKQQPEHPSLWGEEFASFQAAQHPGTRWAQEFGEAASLAGVEDAVGDNWAQEFATELDGGHSAWEDEYLTELEKLQGGGFSLAGSYIFAENNPFLSDLDSFAKGKELFRRGVLTEAVLALEAECQRAPGNAEAWRLLGTVHAENDDDIKAIAALNRALAAAPDDLDSLLSLGVSHTNELEQTQALGYLREWVMKHPAHGTSAQQAPGPPDSSQAMAHVIRLYETAAREAPRDADVHAALGVLYNLSRRYDFAVAAFRAAAALRPQDYSLWNKLGATLANSARSSEALDAYQKALDLKPNYMRAWTNMGISLANLSDYESSARYYVRALALNRQAAAVWGYLRTSLSCAAREDLLEAADAKDIDALMKALPL